MRAGKLRSLIALQAPTRTPDGGGGATVTWATYASVYADFEPFKRSREELNSERLQSAVGWTLTLRYDSTFTILPAHRVLYNNRAFQIRVVRNVNEANHTIELDVEEGVAV